MTSFNSQYALEEALKGRSKNFAILIQIDHPDGNMFFNTGYRNIDFDTGASANEGGGEQVWRGVGLVADLDMPESSSAIEISKFSISLAGVSSKYQHLAQTKVRGNRIQVWIAFLNDNGRVIANLLLEDAIQDRPILKIEDDGTSTLVLDCLGNFAFLANQFIAKWTPEHQRIHLTKLGLDPDSDIGFDAQHGIPDQNAAWYRP